MDAPVLQHAFADAGWTLNVAGACGVLSLALLAWTVLPHGRPGWTRALSGLGLTLCSAVTLLALRDHATKVGALRLEPAAPRLVLERGWPAGELAVGPEELVALGIVTLGDDPEAGEAGKRQLVFGVKGHREIRSFLEKDAEGAEEIAEAIAAAFGLELERFAGPPSRR